MLAVLRIWGATFDVDGFLGDHQEFGPDAVWHKGERNPLGRERRDSGLNHLLADSEDWPSLLAAAVSRLATLSGGIRDARARGAELQVDFGIDAGSADAPYGSAWFSPDELRSLADLGVELRMTAYPMFTVDEDSTA